MITGADLYHVMTAVVPLYVAMILAYGSVKWWKIFTPDQCSGINRFVALFAVPLLSFHFISTNNPFKMNMRFIAADSLQKIIVLVVLGLWAKVSRRGSLEWMITLFSLSSLPNTLVMGIPLLKGMYGDFSGSLMVQIVVLQCIIWYTLMLFMFEYRGAKMLIMDQFPDTAASIVSFKVDSDVVSLDGREPLQTEAQVGEDGKLHVTVRKSTSSRSVISSRRSQGLPSLPSLTPRPSNLTGAEIYSLHSSRNPTPRGSSFNHTDFYSMFNSSTAPKNASPRPSNLATSDVYSLHSSRGPTPRPSNFEDESSADYYNPYSKTAAAAAGAATTARFGMYPPGTGALPPYGSRGVGAEANQNQAGYPAPNPGMFSPNTTARAAKKTSADPKFCQPKINENQEVHVHDKDAHMFVWSSSASPDNTNKLDYPAKEVKQTISPARDQALSHNGILKGPAERRDVLYEEYGREEDFSFGNKAEEGLSREKEEPRLSKFGSSSTAELHPKSHDAQNTKLMPPASVMTRLILIMVWRKLIRNPNTYSSLIGLTWSLVSFRWHVEMPAIISESIKILSDAGLGMAMFSLGLFMALQPKIIACGNSVATFAMAVRFLSGPAIMALASLAIGLRGVLLRVAIVQAALPQGIVPFVFAKEYGVHPDILSTGVIFGMLIALPITLAYYILLELV
ncbi:hypothetical protein SUGI_0516610 [Cryptomeria japonica]|uniref:probable auxin efflux carrier component 1b n=1 Tax=Cryptomeria japonica TaxID=3369 RepID=UPI002408AF3F|nr:probable auxin efflux carrier component 1b [Cryptomeria japonica]GLJ26603.1 hypothetical protein SUGI_0516610 [Cryptomeria japonica]